MKTTFKVGDKVWDAIHYEGYEGEVASVVQKVVVHFWDGNNGAAAYWPDGRITKESKPTLSKVPYKFELPEQPVEFKEGDPVLVRDEDYDKWIGDRFHGEELSTHKYLTKTGRWKQCIPFDIEKLGRL